LSALKKPYSGIDKIINMKKNPLTKIKPGKKCRIVEITGGAALQNRLMGMGIYLGKDIIRLSHFALKGPVMIKVNRSIIALGHGMAKKIIVETE